MVYDYCFLLPVLCTNFLMRYYCFSICPYCLLIMFTIAIYQYYCHQYVLSPFTVVTYYVPVVGSSKETLLAPCFSRSPCSRLSLTLLPQEHSTCVLGFWMMLFWPAPADSLPRPSPASQTGPRLLGSSWSQPNRRSSSPVPQAALTCGASPVALLDDMANSRCSGLLLGAQRFATSMHALELRPPARSSMPWPPSQTLRRVSSCFATAVLTAKLPTTCV